MKKKVDHDILLVCLYMDDILYMNSNQALLHEFRDKMKTSFEMADLGKLKFFFFLLVDKSNRERHPYFTAEVYGRVA